MKFLKHLVIATSAFAMTAGPAVAAGPRVATGAKAEQARAATPVGQAEQLFGEDGGGWILYALLGIALAAGLVVALDGPSSP